MAQKIINNGTFDKDPAAEKIRTAFGKVNDNFTELYNKGTNYRGEFASKAALDTAEPSPVSGLYANVTSGKIKTTYISVGAAWQPVAVKPFHSVINGANALELSAHLGVFTFDAAGSVTFEATYFEGFSVRIVNNSGGDVTITSTYPLVGDGLVAGVLADKSQVELVYDASAGSFYFFVSNLATGGGGSGIQQGADSDSTIDFISTIDESVYDPLTADAETIYLVEPTELETGYKSGFLATGQAITASTPTIIDFTGATFEGDLDLLDLAGKITPLGQGDVITCDIAFSFTTPATAGDYDVWLDVNGVRFRSSAKTMLKANGITDYFSASFVLPVGADLLTYGAEVYIESTKAITIEDKYIAVVRVSKKYDL